MYQRPLRFPTPEVVFSNRQWHALSHWSLSNISRATCTHVYCPGCPTCPPFATAAISVTIALRHLFEGTRSILSCSVFVSEIILECSIVLVGSVLVLENFVIVLVFTDRDTTATREFFVSIIDCYLQSMCFRTHTPLFWCGNRLWNLSVLLPYHLCWSLKLEWNVRVVLVLNRWHISLAPLSHACSDSRESRSFRHLSLSLSLSLSLTHSLLSPFAIILVRVHSY